MSAAVKAVDPATPEPRFFILEVFVENIRGISWDIRGISWDIRGISWDIEGSSWDIIFICRLLVRYLLL